MKQRIIVGLDGTEFSLSAIHWACRRAQTFGGILIGIAILDKPGIRKTGVGAGVGSSYYAQRSIDSKMEHASTRTKEFMDQFERICAESKVPCEIYLKIGNPFEVFKEECKIADLTILGLRTFFKFETTQKPDDNLIRKLMREPVCPIIGVPKKVQPHRNVIIMYSGKAASTRAMRAWAHISPNIPDTYKVKLLTVTDSVEDGEYLLNRAEIYLKAYGIHPEKIWHTGNPENAMYETAKEFSPSLVVVGEEMDKPSYFFGRRTTKLMEDGTLPMFVYY